MLVLSLLRKEVNKMELIFWIVLGAAAGWIASMLMGSSNGLLTDIILGVVGALAGGFVTNLFGASGVTGFNWYSLFVATLGSVILIWLGRVFQRTTP